MDIASYLQSKSMTQNDFAKCIKRTPGYVTKLKKHKFMPSLLEMITIVIESDGMINIIDIIPLSVLKDHGLAPDGNIPSISIIGQN